MEALIVLLKYGAKINEKDIVSIQLCVYDCNDVILVMLSISIICSYVCMFVCISIM